MESEEKAITFPKLLPEQLGHIFFLNAGCQYCTTECSLFVGYFRKMSFDSFTFDS